MSTVREHLGLLWLMRRSLMTQNPQYDRKWEMQAALMVGAHLDELIALAGGADIEDWVRNHDVEIPASFPHSISPSEHIDATERAAAEVMTLLRDAARAWNNEAESELDAAMERIECFLLDQRAQPQPEAKGSK